MKSLIMTEMMHLLVTSGVSNHTHPSVSLKYFECVSRYEKYFVGEPRYIPDVLEAFLDHRGMRNRSAKVSFFCLVIN